MVVELLSCFLKITYTFHQRITRPYFAHLSTSPRRHRRVSCGCCTDASAPQNPIYLCHDSVEHLGQFAFEVMPCVSAVHNVRVHHTRTHRSYNARTSFENEEGAIHVAAALVTTADPNRSICPEAHCIVYTLAQQ